jgi:hypothetical protein
LPDYWDFKIPLAPFNKGGKDRVNVNSMLKHFYCTEKALNAPFLLKGVRGI